MISKKNIEDLILSGIKKELILFEDTANIDNIDTEFSNEHKFFTADAKYFIEKNFFDYTSKDKIVSNEQIIGLRSFDFYGGKIFINYENSDIKTYFATNAEQYLEYIKSGNFFVIPIIISNIVITKDNKIILVKDNKNSDLISDFIKINDTYDGKIDFLKCFERQIQNITGKNTELESSTLIGVYESNKCVLVFSHNINLSSNLIKKANKKNNKLYFLPNKEDDIGAVIKNTIFSKNTRLALKFHIKENFFNYNYVNTKI